MKNKPTKPIHDTNSSTPSSAQSNPALPVLRHVFKLGLDVVLHFIVVAILWDRGAIRLPQSSRARGSLDCDHADVFVATARRRKNDGIDARELCVRLSRHLNVLRVNCASLRSSTEHFVFCSIGSGQAWEAEISRRCMDERVGTALRSSRIRFVPG